MSVSLELQHIEREGFHLNLFVPNAEEVQQTYFQQKQEGPGVSFPHWTRLWPSALAMGDFIHLHPELVQNKNVLELAAGLGFPSFVAARFAQSVCCSDYLEDAVTVMSESVQHLQLSNVTCKVLDWNDLPEDLSADVLLMSDINYDTSEFGKLYAVLQRFLRRGTVILLATPQRLMAKPFIEKLLPFCKQQDEVIIFYQGQQTPISLLLLEQG